MTGVLSLQFLGLVGISSILLWIFRGRTRRYAVMVCNIAFLVLLKARVVDYAYLAGLVLYSWSAGLLLSHQRKRWLLLLADLLPIAGLCWFKYAGYLLPMAGILMPIGLSYYSFKAVSYLTDIYMERCESRNPVLVFDYLVFFPAFFAGPIHRPQEFYAQMEEPFVFDYRDQKNGCVLAGLGLFEKLVISSELSSLTAILLKGDFTGWYTVLGMILYSFYIYVDFDAYSNVAIGAARMMGIHLERNFWTPYLSVDIREFWRRWHISLSTWLRDYVYIPLGGSRHGLFRKYLNTIMVFLVSGLWHGSTMMFVWWGLGHGVLNVLEDLIRLPFKGHQLSRPVRTILTPFLVLFNFIAVTFLWIFFRAPSMPAALSVLASIRSAFGTSVRSLDLTAAGIPYNESIWMIVLLVMVIASDLLRHGRDMIQWLADRPFLIRWIFYFVLMVIAIIFGVYGPGYHAEDFIYVTF
jgi:D-alanyl-lipoteichoic acid acyltransferase DltB (MBOAT superfamily)